MLFHSDLARSARIVRVQRAVDYEWAIVGKQGSKTRAIKGAEAVDDGICVPVCVERRENAGGALGS